jgi:hypothetical protein
MSYAVLITLPYKHKYLKFTHELEEVHLQQLLAFEQEVDEIHLLFRDRTKLAVQSRAVLGQNDIPLPLYTTALTG